MNASSNGNTVSAVRSFTSVPGVSSSSDPANPRDGAGSLLGRNSCRASDLLGRW
jgi:hypothetical protein